MSGRHGPRTIWCLVLVMLATCAAHVDAAEPALLRASLAKPGPVVVGEGLPIAVELMTTTMFASAPVFDLPSLPGALLMKLEDRPVLGTETIEGESYMVQRHELTLFAMRPGMTQVPPFTIRFASPPRFGEKPVEHHLMTPALQVEARMPSGAENLPGLLATRELRVDQTWHPQPQKAHVGDGFTRTVTLTAPDVPSMVFPPLPLPKTDGLAVYPKPPVVQDHVDRGDFTGTRIETITYICERPGEFTLPALIIPWWDLKHQKLMQATLPPVTLQVEPGPSSGADAKASAAEASGRPWLWLWWIGGIILLLAAAVVWHVRQTALPSWERRQARGRESEAGCFGRLLDACRSGETKETYNALLHWLDSCHRGPDSATIADFLARHPDDELGRQVGALQGCILGRATSWDGTALAEALRRARREHMPRSTTADEAWLPALNPS